MKRIAVFTSWRPCTWHADIRSVGHTSLGHAQEVLGMRHLLEIAPVLAQ